MIDQIPWQSLHFHDRPEAPDFLGRVEVVARHSLSSEISTQQSVKQSAITVRKRERSFNIAWLESNADLCLDTTIDGSHFISFQRLWWLSRLKEL